MTAKIYTPRGTSLKERLEIRSNPNSATGCWDFIGNKNPAGYGQLTINRKTFLAHRLSYALYVGPIPNGMHVLHRCDVRACMNPDHLFLGTHQDNMADKMSKGRHVAPKGTQHGSAKLTEANVLAIRADSRIQIEIATAYGISQTAVCDIKNRKRWKHI